jgi:hypothetical protein
MFPNFEGSFIGYYASSGPLNDPPPGYPPVYVTGEKEWHALLQLNTALRKAFPDDMILVLVPPDTPHRVHIPTPNEM